MTSDAKTFHVDLFGRFGLVTVVVFVPILWLASDSTLTLLVALAFVVAAEFGTYYFCTVVVGNNGIVLYRANKADWQDMTAAKQVSFLGLPYLKVERDKGLRWWIPLYLTEPAAFREALATNAPAGNPLREYADNDLLH
jgi:hypothetical protein